MIIDGNNFSNNLNKNQVFNNKTTNNQQKTTSIPTNNVFVTDMAHQKHTNPSSKDDMSDKALSILHERLKNGTISLEEFNKKCNIIGKKRQI